MRDTGLLPDGFRQMWDVLNNNTTFMDVRPVQYVVRVCSQCGHTAANVNLNGIGCVAFQCVKCSTPKKPQTNTVDLSFHVMPLRKMIQSMFKDMATCIAVLDHLRRDLPQTCSLESDRYMYYRKVLDGRFGIDARHNDYNYSLLTSEIVTKKEAWQMVGISPSPSPSYS
jgi:hypothetical protein